MTIGPRRGKLSPEEVDALRAQLRRRDEGRTTTGLRARIGRLLSYPPTAGGNPIRFRFGLGVCALGIALMQFAFHVPDDDRKWFVVAMAVTTVVVGLWQIDKARWR